MEFLFQLKSTLFDFISVDISQIVAWNNDISPCQWLVVISDRRGQAWLVKMESFYGDKDLNFNCLQFHTFCVAFSCVFIGMSS